MRVGYSAPVSLKHRLVGGGGAGGRGDGRALHGQTDSAEGRPCWGPQEHWSSVFTVRSDGFFLLECLPQENPRSVPSLFSAAGRLKLKPFILGERINAEREIKHLLSGAWRQTWKDGQHPAHEHETPGRWNMNQVRPDELGKRKGEETTEHLLCALRIFQRSLKPTSSGVSN